MKTSPNAKHGFKRPIAVLRYLRQEILWHKAEYRALPSHLPKWDQEVWLSNGYTHDKRLVLRQDLLSKTLKVKVSPHWPMPQIQSLFHPQDTSHHGRATNDFVLQKPHQ